MGSQYTLEQAYIVNSTEVILCTACQLILLVLFIAMLKIKHTLHTMHVDVRNVSADQVKL